jgi:hypothetical protein
MSSNFYLKAVSLAIVMAGSSYVARPQTAAAQNVVPLRSHYPGISVEHRPLSAAAARARTIPLNQRRAPVVRRGQRAGDGVMIQLDDSYAVSDHAPRAKTGQGKQGSLPRKRASTPSKTKVVTKSSAPRSSKAAPKRTSR